MKNFTYDGMKLKLKFLSVVGSTLQGVNTKDSDVDYKGVFTWDNDLFFGLKTLQSSLDKNNTKKDEWNNLLLQLNKEFNLNLNENDDVVFYSAQEFVDLSFKNDSNMLDMLYSQNDFVLYETNGFKLLRENKDKFLNLFMAFKRLLGMSQTYFNLATKGVNVHKHYSKSLQMLYSLKLLLLDNTYYCQLPLDMRLYLLDLRRGDYFLDEYLELHSDLKNELNEMKFDKEYNSRVLYFDLFNDLLVSLQKE